MTMYSLPNFCRVCLKYDKNLIDLAHIENEPSETLMSKLEQCVSEVDWTAYKPLLCHPCIKRLNVAYGFKKQCVQSAGVLKSYLELVKETQKKSESQNAAVGDNPNTTGAFMVLPNQKFVKILVGTQQQSSFQNVFLNLMPNPPALTPTLTKSQDHLSNKDTNQNVFVNLNNTMQKFIPIAPNKAGKAADKARAQNNVSPSPSPLVTDMKTEELSVEIDPSIFGLGEPDTDSSGQEEDEPNDWDEVISQSQLDPKEVNITKVNGDKNKAKQNKAGFYGNYVPILPKQGADFLSSGQHFLSPSAAFDDKDFYCEACQKSFANVKMLKHHLKLYHMGKFPVKYQPNASVTLKDFASTSTAPQLLAAMTSDQPEMKPEEISFISETETIYTCGLCRRQFNSSTGLLRHKVRKHHQNNKKKYFIKGMKNAKCDICNREFSTQSYMQLHRKLHMRDDVGYKYKVFGKSKLSEVDASNAEKPKKVKVEKGSKQSEALGADPENEEDTDSDSAKKEKSTNDQKHSSGSNSEGEEEAVDKENEEKENNIDQEKDEAPPEDSTEEKMEVDFAEDNEIGDKSDSNENPKSEDEEEN